MNYFLGGALMPHPPIMLPEIGKNELNKITTTVTAVKNIANEISAQKPDTLVIISPHAPVFSDCVGISAAEKLTGTMAEFGYPELSLTYKIDIELVEKIALLCEENNLPLKIITKSFCQKNNISFNIDKGAFVPLYYLYKAGFNGKIVHLSMGFIPYKKMFSFGTIIYNAIQATGRKTFVLASGDLSHRLTKYSPNGYSAEGQVFDEKVMQALCSMNPSPLFKMKQSFIDAAGECGLRPIFFLFGALYNSESTPQYLSHKGPFGVGYGTALFLHKANKKILHSRESALAKKSLTHYLNTGKILSIPNNLTETFTRKAGVFVSLKKWGQLRGCIGTITPVYKNIAAEIIHNAVAAGTADPRFPPMNSDELADITISVDILSTPEITTRNNLNPQKYGIITAMADGRKGLLLPMLDGIESVDTQISIAMEKGNIARWEKPVLYRFTVTRYY
ncbi:AmmeMemoRadiSam system protein A [Pectinatus sottacetonis]|uniref:AmmeMemoRadiSam system protein A n=1 Tax=Pectinatus sottacetonis TaxID=1002795 RepID=UPI0018C726F2|nr:AmmeMemoRadiSam system protein A [Pectinatus sottacetonis]